MAEAEAIGAAVDVDTVDDAVPSEFPAGNAQAEQEARAQRRYSATLARWVSAMKVLRPDLVRSIFAYQALSFMGSALRGGGVRKLQRLHRRSRATESIDEFWTHSWQLGPTQKFLCLLFLKNGLPASVAGTLAACIPFFLMYYGYLSDAYRPAWHPEPGQIPYFCTAAGTVTSVLTLFLWPSRAKVFLDVCCIDQVDAQKKAEGIASLAGILKQSKRLLVLWDHTYIERLWCVFEVAAFLHRSGKPRAVIRPTLLGPAAMVAWAAIPIIGFFWTLLYSWPEKNQLYNVYVVQVFFYVTFYWATAVMRAYHHSVEIFHRQLRSFRLEDTKCRCCTVNHVAEDGTVLPCDRQIVERCIRNWFGSVQQFEEFAAPLLRSTFDQQLGQDMFPYGYFLMIFCPILWAGLDTSIGTCWPCTKSAAEGDRQWFAYFLCYFLGLWLGVMPTTAKVGLYLMNRFSAPRRYLVCDVLLNLMIVTVMNLVWGVFLQVGVVFNDNDPRILREVIRDSYTRSALLCVTFVMPAVLLFGLPELLRLCRSHHPIARAAV
ncbi:unnamed protein product [Symbiodinium natans]|uniref:Uncharacterized protein n=1 Tax=Symbiodinium natans TaxID=878477 RepID=A0A812R0R6_9DINO|nr:unnamed protein product [Symbiodinium natans]